MLGKDSVPPTISGVQKLAIIIPAVLCLLLVGRTLSIPHALTGIQSYGGGGYDDGLHVGAALRLTAGILPYRDYVFLHPPGIAVLLGPLAAIGRLTSEQDAMALGRLVVAVVASVNVALVAWLVRRCGAVAMLAAGMFLALMPLTVATTRTTLHEPFVILLSLLGVAALFSEGGNGGLRSRNHTVLAGLLFGLALSVKLLAVIAPAAALLVLIRFGRDRLKMFCSAVVLAFSAVTLPFVILAPSAFMNQVVLSQIFRHQASFARSISERFAMMLGLSSAPSQSQATLGTTIFLVFFLIVGLSFFLRRRDLSPFDLFALIAAAAAVAAMLRAPDLMEHYLYVSTTFLALLLGVTIGLVSQLIPRRSRGLSVRWITGAAVSSVILLISVPLFRHDSEVAKGFVPSADDPISWVQSIVPKGACVVADVSTILIVSDRFQSSDPNCPPPVDPFGMWQAQPARKTPFQDRNASEELLSTWRNYLENSDFVVMSVDYSNFLPWSGGQYGWFQERFKKVGSHQRVVLYQKI